MFTEISVGLSLTKQIINILEVLRGHIDTPKFLYADLCYYCLAVSNSNIKQALFPVVTENAVMDDNQ